MIVPVYLNCNNWSDDFTFLSNLISENDLQLLLIGDFNARIADLQQYSEKIYLGNNRIKTYRKSKDIIKNISGIAIYG